MDESEEAESSSDEMSNSEELPGGDDSESDNESSRKKPSRKAAALADQKTEKNKNIQEKLSKVAEKITIQTEKTIKLEDYRGAFGYQIYDGYRPQNLAHTRDYLAFIQKNQESESVLSEENTPKHIVDYLENELSTVLPEYINTKHILRFD